MPIPGTSQSIRHDLVVSLLFVLGVLTQNIQMLPVGSEYQPWIYVGVLPYAFLLALIADSKVSRSHLLIVLCIVASMVVLIILAMAKTGTIPLKDALRMFALPMVALSTWIYLRDVPDSVVRFLVFLHIAFLMLALAAPNVAVGITAVTGGRGQVYYSGWNSYFYSEPSYAAMAFFFFAFFLSRDGRIASIDGLALVVLLMSTLSVTGVFGAGVIAGTLVWQRSRFAFTCACLAVMLGALSLSIIPADTSIRALGRAAGLASALADLRGMGVNAILLTLNAVEPSGAWRVLSNLYGMSCVADAPLGFGSTDIGAALSSSKCSSVLASMLIENPTYGRLGTTMYAQSVFANLTVFAGIPGLIVGTALLCIQLSAFRLQEIRASLPLAIAVVLFFVIWQSAWASPAASLMIAAACRYVRTAGTRTTVFQYAAPGAANG